MTAVNYAGQQLYQIPGLFHEENPVYQSPQGGVGTFLDLTPDQRDRMLTTQNTFSGGLFAQDPEGQTGYQVLGEPVADGPFAGRYFVPIQPSGMVAGLEGGGDPNQPVATDTGGGGVQFTNRDALNIAWAPMLAREDLTSGNPLTQGRDHMAQLIMGINPNSAPWSYLDRTDKFGENIIHPSGSAALDEDFDADFFAKMQKLLPGVWAGGGSVGSPGDNETEAESSDSESTG